MSNLQEQLKKAGLVKPKAKQQPRKKVKPPKAAKKDRVKVSEETLRAQQAMIKKAKRDRALNEQREAERKQREIDAQVTQLIEHAKIDCSQGEESFNFTYNKKVKKIQVTDEQRRQLTRGVLAVVITPKQTFEVVPKTAAHKLRDRYAPALVFLADPKEEKGVPEDDPYAEYEVPDDLVW